MNDPSGAPSRAFDPYQLPQCLARPLVRGWISWVQADAALALAALRHPGPANDPGAIHTILRWLLKQHVEREEQPRALARARIRQRLRPLLAQQAAWPYLLDAAYSADAGEVLTDDEVGQVVRQAVYWELPKAPWRARHGR